MQLTFAGERHVVSPGYNSGPVARIQVARRARVWWGSPDGPPGRDGRGEATPTGDDYAVRIEPVAVWIVPVAVRTDAVADERRRSTLAV